MSSPENTPADPETSSAEPATAPEVTTAPETLPSAAAVAPDPAPAPAPAAPAPAAPAPAAPAPAAPPMSAPPMPTPAMPAPATTFPNGKPMVDAKGRPASPKSRLAAVLLAWFFGVFGVHRFYVGKVGTGILMILTLGGLGIWVLVDMIMILVGSFKDKQERYLSNW